VTALALGRRRFAKVLSTLLAALSARWPWPRRALAAPAARFFTPAERATLEALCERILPEDPSGPGAKWLGAPRYIEALLTALDGADPPRIFAGGPFSGRQPFADEQSGRPSERVPKNSFADFVPLSRMQELGWRAELFGSEAAGLPPHLDAQRGGPRRGLRDVYREGLLKIDQVARAVLGAPFARLSPDRQDLVLRAVDDPRVFSPDPRRGMSFIDLLIRHTLEGSLSAPEYGGNRDGGGFRLMRLAGDSQPLGYSLFSRKEGNYRKRPAAPVSGPDPDEVQGPSPLSAEAREVQERFRQKVLAGSSGGCI
jgi:hypothetical protein